MASINLMTRLANLFKGFLSLFVEDLEKKNPEIAYQNAIDSMIEKGAKLKRATASIIARRERVEAELKRSLKTRETVNQDLNAAMATDQDDLAIALIEQLEGLDAHLAELQAEAEQASADAESAKASMLEVQKEIKKLQTEKDRMLAKMQSAQARIKIQDQLNGLSVDAEVRALDNVRKHIETTVAEATLGQELNDASLEGRLAKLRQSSGSTVAREKLKQMKAARAQPSATGTAARSL